MIDSAINDIKMSETKSIYSRKTMGVTIQNKKRAAKNSFISS